MREQADERKGHRIFYIMSGALGPIDHAVSNGLYYRTVIQMFRNENSCLAAVYYISVSSYIAACVGGMPVSPYNCTLN